MKFTYQFTLEGPEHCPTTSKQMFGSEKAYNPDFPVDVLVRETFHEMVKDARTSCLRLQMECCEDDAPQHLKDHYVWLENKIKAYDALEATLILVKHEKTEKDKD